MNQTVLRTTPRVARYDRDCGNCGEKIGVGDRYLELAVLDPDERKVFTVRTHTDPDECDHAEYQALCDHRATLRRARLHRYDIDTDACACGGMIVYFEDGDDNDVLGHGCEAAGVVFTDEKERFYGR